MIDTAKSDIASLLQFSDPMVGTEGAIKRAPPAGHDADLRKTPVVDNLLMIAQFPSTKGRLSRS